MEEKRAFDKAELAVLVGLDSPVLPEDSRSDEASMDELEALLETAGGECAGRVIQRLDLPDPRTLIGSGKVQEVGELVKNTGATLVIFDNELSPSQVKALSDSLEVLVIDRANLIMDIFARRAQTKEGRLQVELAQYKYLLPRLSGMWGHLVRQTASGGKSPIGTRGPGETQLETDRRHIRRKISALEEDLEKVRRVRDTARKERIKNKMPVAALIGYTNAGKSTILNYFTGAGIPANNRLFDTLDTTTRRFEVVDGTEILLSDTVGFIRHLPHHLVEAFKATLEELKYADLLIHVVDASSPECLRQMEVVEGLVEELGAAATPRLTVFNKMDAAADILPRAQDSVRVSAKSGLGMDKLKAAVYTALSAGKRRVTLIIPYSESGKMDELYRDASVESVDYKGEGIEVCAVCDDRVYGRLSRFVIKEQRL